MDFYGVAVEAASIPLEGICSGIGKKEKLDLPYLLEVS